MSAASVMGAAHQAWAVARPTGSGQVEQGQGALNGPECVASGWGTSKVAGACPGWLSCVHRAVAGAGAHGGHTSLVGGRETSMEGWAGLGTHGACQTELGDVEPGQGARQKGEVCPEGAGGPWGVV